MRLCHPLSSSRVSTLSLIAKTINPALLSQKLFISDNVAGKQETSTVHKGTQFEHRSRALLQSQLSMSLRRVGGRGDGGVDLQGWWWLPDDNQIPEGQARILDDSGLLRKRLRILAQCKAERKKLGPNYVREMEGVLHRHMFSANKSYEDAQVVALFISESSFTKAAVLCALSSHVPFLLVHLPPAKETPPSEEHTQVGSVVWNAALSGESGILRGQFDLRWERSVLGNGTNGGRPGLWWKGVRLRNWTPVDDFSE